MDTTVRIDADTPANARVKAELRGVVVTEVVGQAVPEPAPSRTMPDGETVYFSDGKVLVSSRRFVVGSTTYSMRNISSVTMARHVGSRRVWVGGGLFLVAAGLIPVVAGVPMASIPFAAIGGAFVLSGYMIRPTFVVCITTNAGQQSALADYREAVIADVVHAIERAIEDT